MIFWSFGLLLSLWNEIDQNCHTVSSWLTGCATAFLNEFMWNSFDCGVIFAAHFAVDTSLPIEFKRMAWDSIFWSIKSCSKKTAQIMSIVKFKLRCPPSKHSQRCWDFLLTSLVCMYVFIFFCIAYLKWKKENKNKYTCVKYEHK